MDLRYPSRENGEVPDAARNAILRLSMPLGRRALVEMGPDSVGGK